MHTRKFSFLFLLFSFLAGIIGFFIGEYLLNSFEGSVPLVLLMGIYFGQLALWIGLFCLLAEVISPVINGRSWRLEYSGSSWKMLVPATIGLLFVAGIVFQFIYELNFANTKPPEDIVLVMDISESMLETDPEEESLKAAKNLVELMEDDHRASIITFNDQAYLTQPMFQIGDAGVKDEALKEIEQLEMSGQTDIGNALLRTMDHLEEERQESRKPMVILFSDGYSELDMSASLDEYKKENIPVTTIGMSMIDSQGASLLKEIAVQTGGSFYDVSDANQLSGVFEDIYLSNHERHLVGERTGILSNSVYLGLLRVLLFTLIGTLIGLSLGIIFDNRYLAKSYIVGGLISGVIAGIILEQGLQQPFLPDYFHRFLAVLILAVVVGFGPLIIPVKEKYAGEPVNKRGFVRPDASASGTNKPIHKGFK